jgi:hypothetical protein
MPIVRGRVSFLDFASRPRNQTRPSGVSGHVITYLVHGNRHQLALELLLRACAAIVVAIVILGLLPALAEAAA